MKIFCIIAIHRLSHDISFGNASGQKLGRFDRLLSSSDLVKKSTARIGRDWRHRYNENIVDFAGFGMLSHSSFFLFAPGERNGRERDGASRVLREAREKKVENGKTKRGRAASISNPADCQMTRGMVLPLWLLVLPSFSTCFSSPFVASEF